MCWPASHSTTHFKRSGWQYMHRVIVEDIGEHFTPIEEALANVFIPVLLGEKEIEQLRELFTLQVRQAGLNLPNLAKRASLECTKALVASLHGPQCDWVCQQRQRGTSANVQDEGAARSLRP